MCSPLITAAGLGYKDQQVLWLCFSPVKWKLYVEIDVNCEQEENIRERCLEEQIHESDNVTDYPYS